MIGHILDENLGRSGQPTARTGGNETTVLDILRAMLVHGMVIQGSVSGDHYGPVSIGELDQRARTQCLNMGEMAARLTLKLHG